MSAKRSNTAPSIGISGPDGPSVPLSTSSLAKGARPACHASHLVGDKIEAGSAGHIHRRGAAGERADEVGRAGTGIERGVVLRPAQVQDVRGSTGIRHGARAGDPVRHRQRVAAVENERAIVGDGGAAERARRAARSDLQRSRSHHGRSGIAAVRAAPHRRAVSVTFAIS